MQSHHQPSGEIEVVEPIDLEHYAQQGKKPPLAAAYQIRVDETRFVIEAPFITGRQILALVAASPETHYATMRIRGGHPPLKEVGLDEKIDLTTPGIERFFVRSRQSQPG